VEDWLRQHQPPPKSGQAREQKSPVQQSPAAKQQARGTSPQNSKSSAPGNGFGKDSAPADGQAEQRQTGSTDHGTLPSAGEHPQSTSSASSPPAPAPGGDDDRTPPSPTTPQQQAAQRAKAAQAQQALQEQMDQALANKPATPPSATHELGAAAADDPQSKLPADVRRALQSVPDDPGALLRRKFELEYQQRHGGVPGTQEQP
jgi:Ca-activated chloride channel family protein